MRPARTSICICVLAAIAVSHPLRAADRELKRTDRFPSAAGKNVVVDAANVSVQMRAADVRDLEVATDLRIGGVTEAKGDDWISRHTPSFEDTNDGLTVLVQPGKGKFMWIGSLTARTRLRMLVPTEIIPDITTTSGDIDLRGDFPDADPLRLRTATGQIEFDGATSSLDVRSASGDTRIELFRPLQRLFARTSSGDVSLEGGARHAAVDTASGNVRLSNLSGSSEITTSTGKITLSWDRLEPGNTVSVRSSSGRVRLVLPEDVEPQGTLRTTDGKIRCDLAGSVNEAGDTVTLEGDGPVLEIETASGDILLGRSDGWQDEPSESPPEKE